MVDFLPTLIPRPASQIVIYYHVPYHLEQHQKHPSKVWYDHFDSVADYWDHKRRHPDSHAGAMVIMYKWAPYIIGIVSVLTVNPIGFVYSLGRMIEMFENQEDYLAQIYWSVRRKV